MSEQLYKAALQVAQRAHAPYSKFQVGAAILADNGEIYVGCNIENASYPEGWCAETCAISNMITNGGKNIIEVAVLSLKADLCPPCGGCLQRLSEFGSPEMNVHLCNVDGIITTTTLGNLLPSKFNLE